MGKGIDTIIKISGNPFASPPSAVDEEYILGFGELGRELLRLLELKNGFYAFESCLTVFPLKDGSTSSSLQTWNSDQGWRSCYGKLIPHATIFFAQDTFGNQFFLNKLGVGLFYSESAEFRQYAVSISEWADMVVQDWRRIFYFDLAHEWQLNHGTLSDRRRLIPKIPFVVGGKKEISNLYCGDIEDAMRFRASLAHQLINLPNGTPITLRIT